MEIGKWKLSLFMFSKTIVQRQFSSILQPLSAFLQVFSCNLPPIVFNLSLLIRGIPKHDATAAMPHSGDGVLTNMCSVKYVRRY